MYCLESQSNFSGKSTDGIILQERINLLGKMRNLEHDLEVMKDRLDEEYDAKQEIERQLSKVSDVHDSPKIRLKSIIQAKIYQLTPEFIVVLVTHELKLGF